jgi:hypothetical protein
VAGRWWPGGGGESIGPLGCCVLRSRGLGPELGPATRNIPEPWVGGERDASRRRVREIGENGQGRVGHIEVVVPMRVAGGRMCVGGPGRLRG